MSNKSPRQTAIDQCKSCVAEVRDYDILQLDRNDSLGSSLSLDDMIPDANLFIYYAKNINVSLVNTMSRQAANHVREGFAKALDIFSRAKTFDPTQSSNALEARNELVNSLREHAENFFNAHHSLLAYLFLNPDEVRSKLDTANQLLKSLNDKSISLTKQIENDIQANSTRLEGMIKSAQDTTAELRKLSGLGGVSTQAGYYKEEADSNEKSARTWLILSIGTGAIVSAFAYLLLTYPEYIYSTPDSLYETILLSVGKTIVFGALTTILFFFIRNYNSSKHNATINRHRHIALKTYETIVNATNSPGNRDVVLAYAAQCIFSDQPSGYNKQDHTEPRLPTVTFGSPTIKSGD